MHAAVVRSFDKAPGYETFEEPVPAAGEVIVDVVAAALHPRVRSGAAGSHYTSTGRLPLIPGIDGVGRLPDGSRIYFVAPDTAFGTMADRAAVDLSRSIVLPDGTDEVTVAAGMNPAMSSWVALHRRVPLRPGQAVFVLGATGNAGQMAVQIAKYLGAGRIIGAGRDPRRLAALQDLGADEVVSLAGDIHDAAQAVGTAAADVDLVLDYLWGDPATRVIPAVLEQRADRDRELNWLQIGSMAGPEISLPSVALRSANFRIQGSGQGAVSLAGFLSELPALAELLSSGVLSVNALPVPLDQVESVWTTPPDSGQRIVFIPRRE